MRRHFGALMAWTLVLLLALRLPFIALLASGQQIREAIGPLRRSVLSVDWCFFMKALLAVLFVL